jgi:hypothetical protein
VVQIRVTPGAGLTLPRQMDEGHDDFQFVVRCARKLARSSRWKPGPGKGQRPPGSECCVMEGDDYGEAYTAILWGVGLNRK